MIDLDFMSNIRRQLSIRAIRNERMALYKDLAINIGTGSDPYAYFKDLSTRMHHRGESMGLVFGEIAQSIKSGKKLSQAFEIFAPISDLMVIRGYESTISEEVNLKRGLESCADLVSRTKRMVDAGKKAVAMPAFYLLMIALVLSFISTQLIPQISFTYPPEKWPAFAQPLFYLSKIIANYGDYILYALVGSVLLIGYLLPNWTNQFRERIDQYPPLSLYRDFESGRFLLSLSASMGGSSSLMQALHEIQSVATPWMKSYIQQIRERLSRMELAGQRKSQAMNSINFLEVGLFNHYVLDRMYMLAGRIGIEKSIKVVGTDLIDQITERFVKRSEVLNKWLMGITGLIVLWLIFSMLSVVQEGMSQVVKNIK